MTCIKVVVLLLLQHIYITLVTHCHLQIKVPVVICKTYCTFYNMHILVTCQLLLSNLHSLLKDFNLQRMQISQWILN